MNTTAVAGPSMDSTTIIDQMIANKQMLERVEQENIKAQAKYDALLAQAKSTYNVQTVEELHTLRETVYASMQEKLRNLADLNTQLAAFFAGLPQ